MKVFMSWFMFYCFHICKGDEQSRRQSSSSSMKIVERWHQLFLHGILSFVLVYSNLKKEQRLTDWGQKHLQSSNILIIQFWLAFVLEVANRKATYFRYLWSTMWTWLRLEQVALCWLTFHEALRCINFMYYVLLVVWEMMNN